MLRNSSLYSSLRFIRLFSSVHLGILDGHDDTGGKHELLPRLSDVENVDAILN